MIFNFSWFYFNPHSLPFFIAGCVTLVFGLFVYFKNKFSNINFTFCLVSLSASLWLIGFGFLYSCNNVNIAEIITKPLYTGVIFIPVTFFHFTQSLLLSLPGRKWIIFHYTIGILFEILLLIPHFSFIGVQHYYWGFQTKAGFINHFFILYFHIVFIYCLIYLYLHINNKSIPSTNRVKVKYVFWSFAVSLLGALDWLPVYGIPYYPLGPFFMMVFVITTAYAILKHQLMDIQIVLKRSLIYTAWLIIITVPYIVAVGTSHGIASGAIKYNLNLNLFALTSLLCCIITFFIAIFSSFFAKTEPQRLLGAFNFFAFFWALSCYFAATASNEGSTVRAWLLAAASGYFSCFVFFHLIWAICSPKRPLKYLPILYTQSFIFFLLTIFKPSLFYTKVVRVYDFMAIKASPFLIFFVIVFYVVIGYSFVQLYDSYKKSVDDQKKRFSYLFYGFFIGFVGASTVAISYVFAQEIIYPIGNIFVCIYACLLVYSIFKHNVLDIYSLIKKTVLYSFSLLVISVVYICMIYVLHTYLFSQKSTLNSHLLQFQSLLIIAIAFKPLELYLNRVIERRFFKGTIGQIAEQKERLETELERRERLKSVGILAAGMAHEIKNPLTSIKTFAEYLPKKYDDPEFREKFSRIVSDEVDRVNNIIKQLLEFSKPSLPQLRAILIAGLLEETLSLLNDNLLKQRIELHKDMDSYAMISGDKNQLKQAFLNIFLNSIQAIPEKGQLVVTARTEHDSYVKISIADTGCGISQDQLLHVFDPFYSTKEDGTGLGLAIVHSIITKHGGKIEIQSELGKGTTINVFLKSPN